MSKEDVRVSLLVQVSFDGGNAYDEDGNELVVFLDDGIECVGRLDERFALNNE